jgi:hypothetical protein
MVLLATAGAASGATAAGVTANVPKALPPGPGPVVGTCTIVPASVAASALGMAMFEIGPMNTSQQLSVNGQTVNLNWTECTYSHEHISTPTGMGGLGFTLSFVFESSNAEASAILPALCKQVQSISSPGSYSTPAIGNGSCAQGHTGSMQSSNGVLAVGKVVVSLFGSTGPAQTITILKSIAPLLTPANVNKAIGTSSAMPATGVMLASHAFSVTNGNIAVTLRCGKEKCSGVAELNTGRVVLARTRYVLAAGRASTVNLALTTSGQSAFSNAAVTRVQVTLDVTVLGGKTFTRTIAVS